MSATGRSPRTTLSPPNPQATTSPEAEAGGLLLVARSGHEELPYLNRRVDLTSIPGRLP